MIKRYVLKNESGEKNFSIKVDKVREVIEENGKRFAILPENGDKKEIVRATYR